MNLQSKFDWMRAAARSIKIKYWFFYKLATLLSQGGFSLLNSWAETGETLRSFSIFYLKDTSAMQRCLLYTLGDEWIFGENCRIWELKLLRNQRAGQVTVAGISQQSYDNLAGVLRTLGQLNSSPQSSTGGNTYEQTLAVSKLARGSNASSFATRITSS